MTTFDEILAQCLSDIETGRATADECLARYPELAGELRPLLRTAAAVRNAPTVQPSAAFQAAARTRMLNLIAARQAGQTPATAQGRPARLWLQRWSIVWVRVAIVALLATVILVGTAYAAQDSLPDSPLYPVKRSVEQVQLAVTPGDVRRARIFLAHMDRRAMETAAMARSGKLAEVGAVSAQYATLVGEAAAVSERIPTDRAEGKVVLEAMRDRLRVQQVVLQRVLASAPERTRPAIMRSLMINQRTLERINQRLSGT